MSSSELPEYAARNRRVWTTTNAEHTARPRPASLAGGGDRLGDLWGVPEAELSVLPATSPARTSSSSAAAPPTSRPGSPAAAPGRSASTSRPAQLDDGAALQRETGLEFPLIEADAEERAAAGRIVRPRALGVRRLDLGRPLPVDPGGGAAAPARAASSSSCATRRSSILCQRSTAGAGRCSGRSAGSTGSTGRTTGESSSTSPHGELFALLRETGFESSRV